LRFLGWQISFFLVQQNKLLGHKNGAHETEVTGVPVPGWLPQFYEHLLFKERIAIPSKLNLKIEILILLPKQKKFILISIN